MRDMNAILAGFGGQGILFMGKVIAYAGLYDDKQVSSAAILGPEMRGGTANCSVCISDEQICSPLVNTPNALIVMNLPSFDKFIDKVVPGGTVIVDSALIEKKTDRTDIDVIMCLPTANGGGERPQKALPYHSDGQADGNHQLLHN